MLKNVIDVRQKSPFEVIQNAVWWRMRSSGWSIGSVAERSWFAFAINGVGIAV